MNKRIKAKWIAALRSGEYKQETGWLRVTHEDGTSSFCCLGVLCNLHAQEHPQTARRQKVPSEYMGDSVSLPRAVRRWAGIKTECGEFGHSDLASENDSGVSFKKIAKIIEEHF